MGSDALAVDVSDEPGLLERLYRLHVPRNVRIGYLLIGDLEAARDIVHDAFLRTSGRLHTLRNPDAFGAYMTRSVINASKRHRERRARERRYVETEAARPRSHELQPDVAGREELVTALRALPHRQRAALVLRYYADLPEAEIADVFGSPVGTVRSLISRGLKSLREQMGEQT